MKVYVYIHPTHRPYRACFAIGVQQFYVAERDVKEEINWFVDVLATSFINAGLKPIHDMPPYIKKQIPNSENPPMKNTTL